MAIVKPRSYKCVFVVRIKCCYQIQHINIVITFLYSFLDRVIYVEQSNLSAIEKDMIYKLIIVLYR